MWARPLVDYIYSLITVTVTAMKSFTEGMLQIDHKRMFLCLYPSKVIQKGLDVMKMEV